MIAQPYLCSNPNQPHVPRAKPIPITLWPPEQRINATLGKGDGLKGVIRMRWARVDDVKKKGAKKESSFYKKYGSMAGKEFLGVRGPLKRRRQERDGDTLISAEDLDGDLNTFLAEEEEFEPPAPPSKMYSDYISKDGKTLLERTSDIRVHSTTDLLSGLTVPLPRRPRIRRGRKHESLGARLSPPDNRANSKDVPFENMGHGRRNQRPKKSQQDLDDELEAFLNERE